MNVKFDVRVLLKKYYVPGPPLERYKGSNLPFYFFEDSIASLDFEKFAKLWPDFKKLEAL